MFWKSMIVLGAVSTGCVLFVLVLYLVFTGPGDLSSYPEPTASPYKLPWPEGIAYRCIQGINAVVSHRGNSKYAYDFAMPIGADITAARAGEVVRVIIHHDGNGYKWPNNVIRVRHADGSIASYAHLKRGGAYVMEGEWVEQGQIIGAAGNVGNSMMPHLHFHVTGPDSRHTMPVVFADVSRDAGIPRMFKRYVSGNPVLDVNEKRDGVRAGASPSFFEQVIE